MSRLELLKKRARDRHGEIRPTAGRTWDERLTLIWETWMLWYNDDSGNTHVISEGIDTAVKSCYDNKQEDTSARH